MHLRITRPISHAVGAGKEAVLDLVLPPACTLCNQPAADSADFCRPCELALTLTESRMRSGCRRCGLPKAISVDKSIESESGDYSDSAGPPTVELSSCVRCRGSSFVFQGVAALWAYQERVRDAVVAAKYGHQSPLGDALGKRLGCRIKPVFAGDSPDLVTYVPSHFTRRFSRGGNGNHVIATAVAGSIERPCCLPLKTTRRIEKQAWLDDARRIENVRGAFSLKKSYAWSRSPGLADRHILVVDDVLTTGATANEVARVLLEGGARRVSLAVVARAIRS